MAKLRKTAGMAAGAAALGAAAMVVAPATADAAPAPCGRKVSACIDLSRNEAWLMNAGQVTFGAVPITTGRPGYETPVGTFRVTYKDIDHWSEPYDGPMPYSVFFTESGIAFHEGSLSVQSHGCIHLSHRAAVKFFNVLQPGEVVAVQP
jgi:lipoprotein-anchoring transpeptidase ErfK/SrfK